MSARRRCLSTLLALWSLVLVATVAAAEAPPLVLENLTPSEGLPQGTVYDTLQDSQGFVWLATEDGLIRYDGLELYRYAYSRTAREGLPGNFVREIVDQGCWACPLEPGDGQLHSLSTRSQGPGVAGERCDARRLGGCARPHLDRNERCGR